MFPGQKTTIGGIEEQLLEALRTAQYARFFIEMPLFALYQLEKVYSKPEQEAYGILTPQEQDSVKVTFDVSELIYTHPSGLFDLSKTLEREQKTKELSIFFSTIQSVQYQSDFIIHTLQNNSKHIPFAFARKDITEALSLKAAEIICESFAHEVHKKLAKRINLTNALEETRK